MTTGDDTIIRRYADAVERRGTKVTLRRTTLVNGVSPNPAVLVSPVLDGNHSSGATSIAIRAGQATGRIIAGDKLKIGALDPITVSATATARLPSMDPSVTPNPGFASVSLAAPLPSGQADGAVIVPTWVADQQVWVVLTGAPINMTNDRILAGDLFVRMPSFNTAQPLMDQQLLVNGDWRTVVNVRPVFWNTLISAWDVQAR